MIKWLYIILLFLAVPLLSSAAKNYRENSANNNIVTASVATFYQTRGDTIINKRSKKQQDEEEKNKIKEIARAKKQLKPEKVGADTGQTKKRKQRRPDGMERPPEIIRRNGG
ncbi:hypothetical protein LT679_07670 [Mucilaginibacter roseus]|uniref:Uncharacterized protein n=1 Tax=Mucilaginibacter roseus TaxID=1528868 RepID=A0ABS8U4J2_9SPHI|nr:hypothetical protein [Mucilaginibacter roseus]MCD8740476.1 hypothetical protein [Mucilaginibacter roseus]